MDTNFLKNFLAIVFVAIASTAATYTFLKTSDTAPPKNNDQLASKISLLEQRLNSFSTASTADMRFSEQIAQLGAQISALENRLQKSAPEAEEAASGTSPIAEAVSPELSYEEMMERQAERAKKEEEVVEMAFLEEEVDDTWSANAATTIEETFSNPELAGGRMVSADCRTNTCRVEFELTDADRIKDSAMYENEFLVSVGEEFGAGTVKLIPGEDGGLRYTVYLAKNGHELPVPESGNISNGGGGE